MHLHIAGERQQIEGNHPIPPLAVHTVQIHSLNRDLVQRHRLLAVLQSCIIPSPLPLLVLLDPAKSY